jgi:hypothetical protein
VDHQERGRWLQGFWWESHTERDHQEDLDVGGRTHNKMDLMEIGWCGIDWIDVAQDGDPWRTPVNTKMNLQVP